MMIIDKILDWARGRGYTAVYGSAGQVNETLTDVDFSASEDATAVIMHLVTDSATVDGKDTAVVAVYFASLCDFDFDGEALLPEQERLKNIGKELLNDIRTGNEMTYKDPRWQYGYDDYAENVCWVCLRVTLTAAAAECVPLSPEPPAPTPPQQSVHYCPQVLNYANLQGYPNPARKRTGDTRGAMSYCVPPEDSKSAKPMVLSTVVITSYSTLDNGVIITEELIAEKRMALSYLSSDRKMTAETENWLRAHLGWKLYTIHFPAGAVNENIEYSKWLIAGTSSLESEMAEFTLV